MKVTVVQTIDDHYVPCWVHKKGRRVALPLNLAPFTGEKALVRSLIR